MVSVLNERDPAEVHHVLDGRGAVDELLSLRSIEVSLEILNIVVELAALSLDLVLHPLDVFVGAHDLARNVPAESMVGGERPISGESGNLSLEHALLPFRRLDTIVEPGQLSNALLIVLDLGLELIVDLIAVAKAVLELGRPMLGLTKTVCNVSEKVGRDRERLDDWWCWN